MFTYKATILKVVDGDTVDLRVDLGFSVFTEQRFRLAGINAPELHSKDSSVRAAGAAAKEFLNTLLPGFPLTVRTEKDSKEKYGRYLATIVNIDGVNVNEAMVTAGRAKAYDGGKRE